jgi:hypothetical protein
VKTPSTGGSPAPEDSRAHPGSAAQGTELSTVLSFLIGLSCRGCRSVDEPRVGKSEASQAMEVTTAVSDFSQCVLL